MADAVALNRWYATDVRLGSVVDTLAQLRRSVARTASRTWVMTLVAVTRTDDEVYQATQVMRSLGAHHPARLLIVQTVEEGTGIDASVTIYGTEADGHPLTFDQVGLWVRGDAAAHLDSIVEPFTLSDLPVVVWYPASLPPVSEPLLAKATSVLVDTKEAQDVAGLIALAGRRAIVDLSWMRLRPWREMVAALFDPPDLRPYARRITAAEVAGKGGPRRLLAGWLASRLGLSKQQLVLADARHARIVLRAGDDATFEVGRAEGERLVRASAALAGGRSRQELLPLPDDSLVWSLGEALTHLGRDRVWQQALAAGVAADAWI
ncbi:MAG TPA: glucose-6-phosphate dehydrogenase assembly protein OpcA [Acidimicrobiales bacterium]|nr:glucose-6-phosphate dehydrogenase assembly protein OpcA [Acidimicrobiales bacterium]